MTCVGGQIMGDTLWSRWSEGSVVVGGLCNPRGNPSRRQETEAFVLRLPFQRESRGAGTPPPPRVVWAFNSRWGLANKVPKPHSPPRLLPLSLSLSG